MKRPRENRYIHTHSFPPRQNDESILDTWWLNLYVLQEWKCHSLLSVFAWNHSCWTSSIAFSLTLSGNIALACTAFPVVLATLFTHSSFHFSDSQRPLWLCFPKILYFKTFIFILVSKCNPGDEVTVGGFKECVMMLSGELINGKLQSSPSRFRSTDRHLITRWQLVSSVGIIDHGRTSPTLITCSCDYAVFDATILPSC